MSQIIDEPGFQLWCYACVALFAKMLVNSAIQGLTRVRHRTFVRPDDARVFGRGASPAQREHPLVERMQNCWRNDLENIPIFLILTLGFALAGGGGGRIELYVTGFVGVRILHTVFYIWPRQPWRNLAYNTGVLTTIVVAIELIVRIRAG